MMGVVPGPLTRSALGTSARSPISSRKRSLVIASSSKTASRSSLAATRSNRPTGGKRLGTSRWLGRQRVRRIGACKAGSSFDSATAPSVEVLPYDVQIGDVSGEHALQRRLAAEQRRCIWLAHPGVRGRNIRQQNLQGFVNAEDVRDALQRVSGKLTLTGSFPD